MAIFKFVISEKGKSYQVEKDQKSCPVMGKKIGDKIEGNFLGLEGYEFEITGGSDKDGFPMRKDIEGISRKRIIVTDGTGFHADKKGLRRRKMTRGNSIGSDITQINCKVVRAGAKPLDELIKKEDKTVEKK
jgi:small subunit ribosomal protein S6e